MDPFESYKLYNALKLHFESSYDAVKYNFKTNASPNAFFKRKDKYFFAKVGRMFDTPPELINYYAAHFVADNNWVGDMLGNEQVYRDWQKRTESMGYNFEQDHHIVKSAHGKPQDPKHGVSPKERRYFQKWFHTKNTEQLIVLLTQIKFTLNFLLPKGLLPIQMHRAITA